MSPGLRRIVLAAALVLVHGDVVARPADVPGWRGARWGMTAEDLRRVFGKDLAPLPGRLEYGDAHARHYLKTVMFAGIQFRAIFQMENRTGQLQQVLLRPTRRPGQEEAFASALHTLTKRFGKPDTRCGGAPSGGRPKAAAFVWRFDTSTIHLSFFDFYTRSMAFEDPNTERDVLTPYYKTRRNNPQFLPRRMLIRFHASTREDLIPPNCRSLDR